MTMILQRSSYLLIMGFGTLFACSQFETEYFRSKVDHVTHNVVAGRYGPPHQVDQLPEERSIWTYFDRGTSTTGYTGRAGSDKCTAYLLTFDPSGVLRDWKQQDCSSQPGPFTEPP